MQQKLCKLNYIVLVMNSQKILLQWFFYTLFGRFQAVIPAQMSKQDNLAGDNLTGQIRRQENLSASQFGGKINNFNLPSLVLKRQGLCH